MRPPPLTLVVVAKNQGLLYPTVSTTATPTSTSRWRPNDYSNSNHFEANAVAVLIILTCALTCALALSVAIRCFLRRSGSGSGSRSPHQSDQQEVEQRKASVDVHTDSNSVVLVYSAGGEEVECECVICLSEFAKGDVIQLLGRCKHGFHVSCIQQWLSLHYSCPTCRCTCLPSPQSLQE